MKKLLLLFAAILMASTGLWAQETQNVSYLYPVYNTEGDPASGIIEWKTASVDATVVENASEQVTWTAGWYVVTGTNVTLSQGAICAGNVNLILADGAKLTATGIDDITNSTPGIQVSGDGNSLVIYGQTAQTGILKATGNTYSAGIGGISTNGLQDGSNITINGGTITADGGSQAAAIGGGLRGNGSNITINGGTVTARGSAAGIGGGCYGNGTNITINGGTVTARGGNNSDGIGNGENATTPSSNIFVVTWCIVKAGSSKTPTDVIENTGSDLASSLEGKQNVTVETPKFAVTYGDNITVSPAFASGAEIEAGTQITFTAADRTADGYDFGGFYKESTFDTPITTGVNGQAYTVTLTDAAISVYARYCPFVSYVYPVYNTDGVPTSGIKEWKTGTVSATVVENASEQVTWTAGWYVVTGTDVTLSQGAICSGEVHLILADGAKLTANGAGSNAGITTDKPLTIYGQTAQSGQLEANGGAYAAGIGGAYGGIGEYITINGGIVTATSLDSGAGIGGGKEGRGDHITINGGTVTVTSLLGGAGIGGGSGSRGNFITINGGTVTTNCLYEGASGIGGGRDGFGYNISIAPTLIVKAGNTENPTDVIANNGGDLAVSLMGKQYVTVEPNSVSYVYPVYNDPDDVTKGVKEWETETVNAIEVISSGTPVIWGEEGKETWYVVTGEDVKLSQGAICAGDVNLILADGAKLMANGNENHAGIQVSGGNALTINGQAAQSGQLIANGGLCAAGIGGGKGVSGSNITINGGIINASSGDDAAGIGGGYGCSGSYITINAGIVVANGEIDGAGIGGGSGGDGSYITINGGTVTASSLRNAAGIGGGSGGDGSNITINDGTVTATGALTSAGIGGGWKGVGSNITINGGTVTANGGGNATGIGSGYEGSASSNIIVDCNLMVKAGSKEHPTDVIENNGGDRANDLAAKQYVTIEPMPTVSVSYVYPVYNDPYYASKGIKEWGTETVNAIEVTSSDTPVTWGMSSKDTWYVVTGTNVTLSQGAICAGNVNLILADGAKLTATGKYNQAGIQVSTQFSSFFDASLTIYAQSGQSGQLYVFGGESAAGIGGGYLGSTYNITINGGTVTATGGAGAAGIGGGHSGHGYFITINDGVVTANGGAGAAGIGGGFGESGNNITINGGTVTANGGEYNGKYGDGIGSGEGGSAASKIFVATNLIMKADGSNPPTTVIENTGSDLALSLAGKRYVTITEVFNITANQDPNNKANYYSTFYSGKKAYSVPEGVTAYTGAVDGSVLKLTAIEGGIIPAGEAVILRLTTEDNTATKKQLTLTAMTTKATKSDTNELKGTDVATTLGASDYALSLGQYGVGFYNWSGRTIDAHKAYLTLPSAQLAPGRSFGMIFDDGTFTGIPATIIDQPQDDVIYNLQGQRVDESYKGLIIKNGQKVYNY